MNHLFIFNSFFFNKMLLRFSLTIKHKNYKKIHQYDDEEWSS